MEASRRSFMKSSGIAAGTLLSVGLGVQGVSADSSNNEVRFRGSFSNPVSVEQIRAAKARVMKDTLETSGNGPVPNMERPELPDDHRIVAFNFDVIDGTPYEWAGILADPANAHEQPDSLADVRQQRVANVHEKARRNANSRAELRAQADSTTSTQDVSTQATTSWPDWNSMYHNRDSFTGSNGNETGHTVNWKNDPDDWSNQAVEAEVRMHPQPTDQWTGDWQNRWAFPQFNFNGSGINYVSDYGPGNTVGSVTNTISLSLSTDKTLEIGASKSNTSSEIDVDNHSDTDGGDNYVHQKFSISGDLKWNTVRVNQGASTVGTTYSSGDDYCNIDLKAKYRWGGGPTTTVHTIPYRLYWS